MDNTISLPASLNAVNLPPLARSILREALAAAGVAGHRVSERTAADYVALAAAQEHRTAIYVKHSEFSIAVDQHTADLVHRSHPQLVLERRNVSGAAYLHAGYDVIDRHRLRAVVVDLTAKAFTRSRAIGPQVIGRRAAPQRRERAAASCPVHHLQLANGRCDDCD